MIVDVQHAVPAMNHGSEPSFSPHESDFSTGYLEDALIELGERSKRRRLLPYADIEQCKRSPINDLEKVELYILFEYFYFYQFETLLLLGMSLNIMCIFRASGTSTPYGTNQ